MTHEDKIRQLKSGKAPMNREGMISVIEDQSTGGGPGSSMDAWARCEEEWDAAAHTDWIDILLALVADPPPEDEQTWDWDSTTICFLGRMVEKFPAEGFAKVTALLPTDNGVLRPYLISGLSSARCPEARAWLQPFVDNIESLPFAELAQLSDALTSYDAEERCRILLRIRDAIPPIQDEEHDELRADVDGYIINIRREMGEEGGSGPAST